MGQVEGVAEELIDALRETLAGAESLEDLIPLAAGASEELVAVLCDIAAGEYEPHLALDDLVESVVVETGIRGFCATR